ncbi:MAG: SpoIIE family protein phosphatase [Planctomycetota bacterium]
MRFALASGETTIGRHPDCTIVVDAGAVSRLHARVVREGPVVKVEDAGSRNGTFVNGQMLSGPHALMPGDRIRISEVEFTFQHEADHRTPGSLAGANAFLGGSDDSQNVTFDGQQFGVMMVDDDESVSRPSVEFRSDGDSLKMVATPEAKLQALIRITQNLSNALAIDDVLPVVLSSLFEIFPAADRGFVVLKGEDDSLIPRWVKTRRGNDDETVRISRTIVRNVMDRCETILSFDASDDSRFDSSQSIADFSIRSLLCAPLVNSDGEPFGVLQIDSTRGQGQFRDEDVDLMSGIATQAGVIINNAAMHERALQQREVEQDLKLATDVQRAFLPRSAPEASGFRMASHYQAANHIGGDYYDYVRLPDGRIAIVMADVVGHGVAAAMFMAKLAAETRFCLASQPDVSRALESLNDRMSEVHVDRFVTLAIVVIDPQTETMTIVNAGHMPPIVRDAAGNLCEPGEEESGLPIAIETGMDYQAVTHPFLVGDLFVLYTDGVNEAMDANDEEFGIDRVRKLVAQSGSAEDIVGRIVREVKKHVGDAPPFDDMALVVIERVAVEESKSEDPDGEHSKLGAVTAEIERDTAS